MGSLYSGSHHPKFPLLFNSARLVAIGCVLATNRSRSQSNDWPNSRSNQIFGSINSNSFSNGEPDCFTDCNSNCDSYTQANRKAQIHTQAAPPIITNRTNSPRANRVVA